MNSSIKGMAIGLIAAMSMGLAACSPDEGEGSGGGGDGTDTQEVSLMVSTDDVQLIEAVDTVETSAEVEMVEMVHPMTGQPITDADITAALGGQTVDLSEADVTEAERRELERATGIMMIAMGGCIQANLGPDCAQMREAREQLERLAEASGSSSG